MAPALPSSFSSGFSSTTLSCFARAQGWNGNAIATCRNQPTTRQALCTCDHVRFLILHSTEGIVAHLQLRKSSNIPKVTQLVNDKAGI